MALCCAQAGTITWSLPTGIVWAVAERNYKLQGEREVRHSCEKSPHGSAGSCSELEKTGEIESRLTMPSVLPLSASAF